MLWVALFVVACGDGSTESNPIPTPTPIPQGGNGTIDPGTGSGIPAWLQRLLNLSKSLTLTDGTDPYPGLQDLSGAYGDFVSTPIVGTPRIVVEMPAGSATTFNGSKFFLGVEGADAFWYLTMKQFKKAGIRNNSSIDIIFSDDIAVVRAKGSVAAGIWNGTVYYRVRNTAVTSETQVCKEIIITCPPGYPFPCPQPPDTLVPCQQYMDTSSANVKSLGTFSATTSTWRTLPEAN